MLACVRRSETFEQAPYEDLEKIGAWLGCAVKRRIAVLPNATALAAFNGRVETSPKWGPKSGPIEGCVMEGAGGEFYKLKGYYYRNWKRVRSAVNYMRKAKLQGKEADLGRYEDLPEPFQDFLAWAQTLSPAALEHDIVTLRDSWEGDRSVLEAIHDPHLEDAEARRAAEQRDRFSELIKQIADNDQISTDGLARFVLSAMEDPTKAEVLREHERFAELLRRADLEFNQAPGL